MLCFDLVHRLCLSAYVLFSWDRLRTDEDGFARNVLWVSNTNGQKLTDGMADLVGERMGDFISYCTPDEKALKADEFRSGPIVVSNKEHESLTVLTIQGEHAILPLLAEREATYCTYSRFSFVEKERVQKCCHALLTQQHALEGLS